MTICTRGRAAWAGVCSPCSEGCSMSSRPLAAPGGGVSRPSSSQWVRSSDEAGRGRQHARADPGCPRAAKAVPRQVVQAFPQVRSCFCRASARAVPLPKFEVVQTEHQVRWGFSTPVPEVPEISDLTCACLRVRLQPVRGSQPGPTPLRRHRDGGTRYLDRPTARGRCQIGGTSGTSG